jgi:hypothetical protein
MFENIDLSAILEEKTRELVKGLLNFIEQLSSNLREARRKYSGCVTRIIV